jgi:16S rRNA (adenine1518-N6/adenine1519-N6)-dimethyltransferase
LPGDHPRELLGAHGLRPKKHLGQNFLIDADATQRIARLVLDELPADSRSPILEIGAGTGELTRALVEGGADVTAIEVDGELVSILRSRDDLRAATIVAADAMTFDYAAFGAGKRWYAAGNLPYNIATSLIVTLCELRDGPQTFVAMIQKDVADRLAAAPGSPSYGSLSVAVQYTMRVERAFTLGPRVFFPPPKVDSTVVRLVRRDAPAVTPKDERLFKQVVRAAFAYRRKTLANSLSLALKLPRNGIAASIAACGFQPEIRGEQLDLAAFARLADALAEGSI